ncbi:ribulose-phosphate 3-epimerase [Candidatus Micrarchaeota archaeon]|nr:ribulose-phosphate 3-epimerase [Candidatus Micrarchaeota archaeon]
MEIEIIPAILVKKRDDLLSRITAVSPHVSSVQIDLMDGRFVQNTTIWPDALEPLPKNLNYELHWMVSDPKKWIEMVPGNYLHTVHIESTDNFGELLDIAKNQGGKMGIAFNPPTPVEKLLPYADKCERILALTVNPGFSQQSYIPDVEAKISHLRSLFPDKDIEVDGGINPETIIRAAKAGANKLSAASAIFNASDIKNAISLLRDGAERGFRK